MTHLLSTMSKRLLVLCCSFAFLLISFVLPTSAFVHANPSSQTTFDLGYQVTGNQGEFKAADVSFTVPKLTSGAVFMGVSLGYTPSVSIYVISSWNSSTQTQSNIAGWLIGGPSLPYKSGSIDQPQPLTINAGDRIDLYVGSNATGPYDGFQVIDTSPNGTQTSATHYEYSSNEYSDATSATYYAEPFFTPPAHTTITLTNCIVEDNSAFKAIGVISPQPTKLESRFLSTAHTSDLRDNDNFDVTFD